MKEYRISELMENYTDNELFLEGEQTVDTEKAVSELLAQVKPKKRIKPVFKVFIAAAAAVSVLAGAVVGSDFLSGSFTSGSGVKFKYEVSDDGSDCGYEAYLHYRGTLTTENDRLYLKTGDETVDITDLTDEKTPYIHSYTNPGTGDDAYIIAVGTPTHYEFVDLFRVEGIGWVGFGCINGNGMNHIDVEIDHYPKPFQFDLYDGDPEFFTESILRISYNVAYDVAHEHLGRLDENGVYVCINDDNEIVPLFSEIRKSGCPEMWLINAMEQLDLT